MIKKLNVETEQKILKAARKVLINKGKNGARMQEIADEAGVNKALLHYYFRSKDKLYTKVLSGVLKNILESVLLKIDPQVTIKDFLKQFINNHINFLIKNQEVVHFFLGEISTNHEKVAELMKKQFLLMGKPAHQLITAKIEKAIVENEIAPIEPTSLMINVLSLDIFFFVISPIVHIILETPKEKQEKILAERGEHVFNFVWNSIKKK